MNHAVISLVYIWVQAFLTRLESAEHTDLQASDWDLVKVLIRSGTLSLASNPKLIEQATLAHRFDVLAQIVRYVSDLTERQCARILRLCLYVSDNSLVSCFSFLLHSS